MNLHIICLQTRTSIMAHAYRRNVSYIFMRKKKMVKCNAWLLPFLLSVATAIFRFRNLKRSKADNARKGVDSVSTPVSTHPVPYIS